MKCEVILAFSGYSVGNIIEPTGLWRDNLISRGFIKPIVEKQPEPKQKEPYRRKRFVPNVD